MALATALRKPFSSLAPNLWETNTANPLDNPVANPLGITYFKRINHLLKHGTIKV